MGLAWRLPRSQWLHSTTCTRHSAHRNRRAGRFTSTPGKPKCWTDASQRATLLWHRLHRHGVGRGTVLSGLLATDTSLPRPPPSAWPLLYPERRLEDRHWHQRIGAAARTTSPCTARSSPHRGPSACARAPAWPPCRAARLATRASQTTTCTRWARTRGSSCLACGTARRCERGWPPSRCGDRSHRPPIDPSDLIGPSAHHIGAGFTVETWAAITFQPTSAKRTQVWLCRPTKS